MASQPIQFNIYYHVANDKSDSNEAKVVFPVNIEMIDTEDNVLRVAVDQHYCWMCSNKTTESGQKVGCQPDCLTL